MNREEIKSMYLLNAEVRKFPPCDPRREQGEAILAEMTSRYLSENVTAAPAESGPVAHSAPDWQSALGYIAELFSRLDETCSDKAESEFRRNAWNAVATAAQVFYQDPDLEEKREQIFKTAAKIRAAAAKAEANENPGKE